MLKLEGSDAVHADTTAAFAAADRHRPDGVLIVYRKCPEEVPDLIRALRAYPETAIFSAVVTDPGLPPAIRRELLQLEVALLPTPMRLEDLVAVLTDPLRGPR
jgi:hypothetical protein